MIKRLSGVLFGLVLASAIILATGPSAQATAPATLCIGNWVNAPCIQPLPQAKPVAPRIVVRAAPPRRQLQRQEPLVERKLVQRKLIQRKLVQRKLVERKLVRVAARTAKICIGNWVNAACAAP